MINSRFVPLMRKEFLHISRDRRSLGVLFLMPLMMIFVFGYAINMDVKNIRLGICDLSRTPESRSLVEAVGASPYFNVVARYEDPRQTADLFEQRVIRAAIIIPRNLGRAMAATGDAQVGIITDGTNANTATLARNYLEGLLLDRSLSVGGMVQPVRVRTRILYNPDMESAHFIVPGIVALLLIMIGALLTSVTIAREKETGTMEQILVSPIRPYEVVLGKAVPYLVLAFGIAVFIIVFGHLWFSVPMLGSWTWLMAACLLYLVTALAIGLLISTLVATQQVAMMLSLVATMLPSVMLSGFVFPVASMPLPLQVVSQIIPATHFLIIIRGIMLKGNGLLDLWPSVLAMLAVGVLFIGIAIKRFRLKLQ